MKRNKGFFITGTDTGVGKTVAAATLALLLRGKGLHISVMKPVETGCKRTKRGLIPEDGTFLRDIANIKEEIDSITPLRYELPLAPLVSSEIEGKKINLDLIKESFHYMADKYDAVIVEGIGGLMVPLEENYYVYNLIKEFSLPAIIVTRSTLGTLNHTLLSIQCAQHSEIELAGIIINHSTPDNRSLAEKTNPDIIKRLCPVPVIGILPYIASLDIGSLSNAIKDLDYDIIKKCLSIP